MWVFVWIKYGASEVYAADTKEQLRYLLDDLNLVAGYDGIMSAEDFNSKYVSLDVTRKAIGALLRRRISASDDADFERGTGFTKLENYQPASS